MDPPPSLSAELKRHLWDIASTMLESMDSGIVELEFFALLFFKRASDSWMGTRVSEVAPPRFHIPRGHTLADVLARASEVGAALNSSLRAIATLNPRLNSVFDDVDFASWRYRDEVIRSLLHRLNSCNLGISTVPSTMLGDVCEHLITRFALHSRRMGSEFSTPSHVAQFMVELLQPEPGSSIYDPACGAGGMLREAVRFLERRGEPRDSLSIHGQEINPTNWAICKLVMLLHDIDEAHIEHGDTLRNPKHLESDSSLQHFNFVISNPPFSLGHWGYELWSSGDRFERDIYGLPPQSRGDLAFVQHMIKCLGPTGRMVVICPPGVLFRGGGEFEIRRGIIEADLLETIIGLGPNLLYESAVPPVVLIINRNKPPARQGLTLIINGDKHFVKSPTLNHLSNANLDELLTAAHHFRDQEFLCRVVGIDELRTQNFDLSITRYIQSTPIPPRVDVQAQLSRVRAAIVERNAVESRMNNLLRDPGHGD